MLGRSQILDARVISKQVSQLTADAKGLSKKRHQKAWKPNCRTQDALSNVWSVQERNSPKANQGSVWSVNFSPDGKTIVSGSSDGTVKIFAWDVEQLLHLACAWANDYLRTNPDVSDGDRAICGIPARPRQ